MLKPWLAITAFGAIVNGQSRTNAPDESNILPQVALEAQQTILSKADAKKLGMTSAIWSDSTMSLANLGSAQKIYGTVGDGANEQCDGLVGFVATGLDDLDHPEKLPSFRPIQAKRTAQGCLMASPNNQAIAKYRTPACQKDPACAEATPFDNDYTSLTSVVRLPNGWFVGFAHGETHFWDGHGHPLGKGDGFYSRIGLYISRDGGRTFVRYSSRPVIEMNVRFETVYKQGASSAIDISGGAAIVTPQNMVYVYYSDRYDALPASDPDQALASACGICITAAAISIEDLTKAISAGQMPALKKYYRGAFTQPAVGGRFSPVVSPEQAINPKSAIQESWIVWPTIAHSERHGLYVMAYMSGWGGTRVRTSTDGLTNWSKGEFISPHLASNEPGHGIPAIAYPTIVASGRDYREIPGDNFYLYYQAAAWNGGFDWEHSLVVRRRVSLAPRTYSHYVGHFSYTGGFLGYSNGQGHYCTISDMESFAKLGGSPAVAYTTAHIEPSEEGWTSDGSCRR